MTYPIEASCQCGQISYKLLEAPKMVVACHCQQCQKLSTAPFSVTAVVAADGIVFSGEFKRWSRLADSGKTSCATFCPGCGNRIYHYDPDDLTTIKLKLKPVNLPDDTVFEPTVHVWASEKLSWSVIPDGVTVFERQP